MHIEVFFYANFFYAIFFMPKFSYLLRSFFTQQGVKKLVLRCVIISRAMRYLQKTQQIQIQKKFKTNIASIIPTEYLENQIFRQIFFTPNFFYAMKFFLSPWRKKRLRCNLNSIQIIKRKKDAYVVSFESISHINDINMKK